jgi:hypothetical protein
VHFVSPCYSITVVPMMTDVELKAEKPQHVESRIDPRYDLSALTTEDAEFLASFSEEDRKRVIRKVSGMQKID